MSKKIKIIHIIGALDYGGAERLLLDLGRKIDREKFDLAVVSLAPRGTLADKFDDAGVKFVNIPKRFKGDIAVIGRLAAYLKQSAPDIVHTHLNIGDLWGGRAARKAGVKIIVSTRHDVMREGIIRGEFGKAERRQATKIIAISEATKKYLIEKEKVAPEKIVVIYNGIDVSRYWSEKEVLNNEEIVFGSVGRLSREKGHRYLIQALARLKFKNWQLILVGDGPERLKIDALVKKNNLVDRVKFVGATPEVVNYLEQMDVFVLPSLSEGLSLAAIEAGLNGKFVIASDVGGVPEIVSSNKTGLLVPPGNIEALVETLDWVSTHRSEARLMAKKLQKELAEKFDIGQIIKQYEDFYLGLVKKGK
jgi:glycosyltransferase involved in cell wall biosynthesis